MQKSPNPVGSKWLANWSQDIRQQQQRQRKPTAVAAAAAAAANGAPTADAEPIRTMPFIAESSLRQLQQLYGKPTPAPAPASAADAKPLAVGTLPATSMDAMVAQLNKVRFGNSVVPKMAGKRNEAQIAANLMDVDLS